jgi:glucan phosphoethanolaminetransferase (alkaline phosphatase superfamily)
VATIACIFTLIMIFANAFFMPEDPDSIFSKNITLFCLIITALLFLIIIIKPAHTGLFGVIFFYEAILTLMDGTMTIGGIFTLLSVGIAVKYGFFRKYKNLKIITAGLLLTGAIVFYSYHIPHKILPNMSELALYGVVLATFYLLFKDNLQEYFSTKQKKSLTRDFNLTEKEAAYVLATIGGKLSKEIAAEHRVESTTIRTALHRTYPKIGVEDAKQLLVLSRKIDFIP